MATVERAAERDNNRPMIHWHWPKHPDMPWRLWLWATAHDDASWFVRIVGLEFNLPK